ncbi:MAG TPA: YkgJ family cysteine cluster protein [Phycisphaerales bacterium]|nr:YkgJ family cysteine cluster protein [Phycisphaerales bacterium]
MLSIRLPILDLPVRDQHYSCHGCGNCCRDFTVQVRPEDLKKLSEQKWEQRLNQHVTTTFRGQAYLRQNPDGSCIFLLPNGKCRIHAEFGFSQKPIACQVFPFHFNPAPARAHHGTSVQVGINFACQSVLENKGADLRTHRAELSRMTEDLSELLAPVPLPRLTEKHHAVESEIQSLESMLDDWLTQDLPLNTIIQGFAWIVTQLSSAQLENVREARFAELLDVLRSALPDELEHIQVAAPRPGQVKLLRQAAFARTEDPKLARINRSKLALKIDQLRRSRRFRVGRGLVPQVGIDWPTNVPFSAIDSVQSASPGEDALLIHSLLIRYLRASILSGRSWGAGYYGWPIIPGLAALVVNIPVISWLARVHAAGEKRRSLTIHDVRKALGRVDRTAGRAAWLGSTIEKIRIRYLTAENGLLNLAAAFPLLADASQHNP